MLAALSEILDFQCEHVDMIRNVTSQGHRDSDVRKGGKHKCHSSTKLTKNLFSNFNTHWNSNKPSSCPIQSFRGSNLRRIDSRSHSMTSQTMIGTVSANRNIRSASISQIFWSRDNSCLEHRLGRSDIPEMAIGEDLTIPDRNSKSLFRR
jgi:hypothetical protein